MSRRDFSLRRNFVVGLLTIVMLGLLAACGTAEPTPEPTSAAPTPTSAATAEPTAATTPGAPTPTPAPATAMPTATPDSTFDAAAYFEGRTIEIIDGFSPGGGSDTLARMFARVAQRHFPGNPRFVVRNVPGGGGLRGLQYTLEAGVSETGTFTLGMVHSRWIYRTIGGQPVEGFDLARVKWLGVPNLGTETQAVYVRRDIATSWAEVLDSGMTLTVGGTTPGASGGTAGAEFIAAVGGPIEMVYGYGGTSEIAAAFDRGEVTATGGGTRSTVERLYPEWVPDQYLVPVYWWRSPPDNEDFREWLELLNAEEPIHIFDAWQVTDVQKNVFDVLQSPLGSSTSMLHPDTPDEVYQAVRQAWEDTVSDEEYIQLKLAGGFEEGYVTGDAIERTIGSALDLSGEGLELYTQLLGLE